MTTDPSTYVIAFTDGTIYEFDDVVDATVELDNADSPAPLLTLGLVGNTAIRLNWAAVKFIANRDTYLEQVRQR